MTTEQKQAIQQAELHKKLWNIANDLRGTMEANEFKNYILGLIFYRYLSEKAENHGNQQLVEDKLTYQEAFDDAELKPEFIDMLLEDLGYYIQPEYLYNHMIEKIKIGEFDISYLQKAIDEMVETTLGKASEDDFHDLFNDMDLQSTRLGRDNNNRTALIAKVMLNIADIQFDFDDTEIDVLGDAYEYLISQFAATAGKKAGEFYTPQQVSEILARIVTINKKDLRSVYDPTCGSGSLLLRVNRVLKERGGSVRKFYGQELTITTYNLARMNMLLHNIRYDAFDIRNGDTLSEPAEEHMGLKFEAVVANPPYSANWEQTEAIKIDDRFAKYGKLAPKTKADFAFVQHMIHYLDDNGTAAVVLPHGVLFRGAAEGTIRQYIIEKQNYLDAVIGLPANIFFGTSIPTVILVFKKCRETEDIFFIDASKDFEKQKNQNRLRAEDVDKIINAYSQREEIEKYSRKVPMSEIIDNEYNLNIPRYIDTFEEEEPIDIVGLSKEMITLNAEIKQAESEFLAMLDELAITDESKDIIEATKEVFR